ncbi:ComEC/Rec2 family competence protein [Pseudenhygromyxa sp. WMMC2535]|uniref:ComEC/Rec2 family competence protein n=1 Tax=Pseudenhygromyxa sp. WMMC2535 TaxID=2712867 RepID=UPI001556004A|nr:ComEC/Rec2 family competence protein [Pseudenhygromyxa sp. WMMC2535]NVB39532.1 ComEC/Rec2 family competence protein [Pseudenhygromyxa sp. WMMC2535]
MRSISLALVSLLAVICGIASAHLGPPPGGILVVLALLSAALLSASLGLLPVSKKTRESIGLGAALAVVGLLRGLSPSPEEPARVPDRGAPSPSAVREFEVLRASEPGPRCQLWVRGRAQPRRARVLRLSGPPELCPRAAGDRVAVLARRLRPDPLARAGDLTFELGEERVWWPRPARPPELGDAYWHWVAAQRQRAWTLSRGDPQAGLAVAVGVGARTALPPEHRRALRRAGLGHLLAVSGMHVAVAALWILAGLRRAALLLGASPRQATLLAWLPLWAYVGLTGAPASAIRAAIMLTGIELATIVGRPTHGPTLLAWTAAAMLMWRPSWAMNPGFQLSLAAMAAIVTDRDERGPLAMSWRISWATAPLSVAHFGSAPLVGVLANALALPLFALLMPLAALGTLSSGWLGAAALVPARILAAPILSIAATLEGAPPASAAALAGLALAALILHRLVPHLARRHERFAALPPWLPPRLVCAAALVPALLGWLDVPAPADSPRDGSPRDGSSRFDSPRFEWIAVGSVASRSLLVADPSRPRAACLFRPTLSAGRWLALFEDQGVAVITHLDAALPAQTLDGQAPERVHRDPRVRDLRARFEEAGVHVEDGPGRCRPPPRARVRAALRACRFRHGGHGRALVRAEAGALACYFEGRWVAMPELSEFSDQH